MVKLRLIIVFGLTTLTRKDGEVQQKLWFFWIIRMIGLDGVTLTRWLKHIILIYFNPIWDDDLNWVLLFWGGEILSKFNMAMKQSNSFNATMWENHRTQWMFHRQWILCTAKPSEKVTIQWSGRIVRSHRYPICTTNQHFVGVSHPLVFFIRGAKAASSYEQQNLFWKFTSLQYLYIGQHISCVFNTTTHGNFECQKWRI